MEVINNKIEKEVKVLVGKWEIVFLMIKIMNLKK
jgi:hypothetical protein